MLKWLFNPFRPHLVRVGDKYAIRRWCFGWELLDMCHYGHWWGVQSGWARDCYATLEDAQNVLQRMRPERVVV